MLQLIPKVVAHLGSAFVFEGEALESLGDEYRGLQAYEQAAVAFDSHVFTNRREPRLMNATAFVRIAGALARLGYPEKVGNTYRKALAMADVRPDSPSISVPAAYTLIAIYTGLADIAARSPDARRTMGTGACGGYKTARDLWLKLPVRNAVSPAGFKVPEFDAVSNKLATCK